MKIWKEETIICRMDENALQGKGLCGERQKGHAFSSEINKKQK